MRAIVACRRPDHGSGRAGDDVGDLCGRLDQRGRLQPLCPSLPARLRERASSLQCLDRVAVRLCLQLIVPPCPLPTTMSATKCTCLTLPCHPLSRGGGTVNFITVSLRAWECAARCADWASGGLGFRAREGSCSRRSSARAGCGSCLMASPSTRRRPAPQDRPPP